MTSDSTNFFIPEFGVNWRYRPDVAFGLTVLRQRRHEHNYPGGQIGAARPAARFGGGSGPVQPAVRHRQPRRRHVAADDRAPTRREFTKGHWIGIAPVIAYQRFSAEGLQAFDNPMFSTSPGNVTK